MLRLSRLLRLPRWMIVVAAIVGLAMVAGIIYLLVLTHRVSRELVSHSWRQPTVIVSAATKRPVVRLYGVDWRVMPPVSLRSLPPHVADAFIAAEDVRFRRHLGVDPVGLIR